MWGSPILAAAAFPGGFPQLLPAGPHYQKLDRFGISIIMETWKCAGDEEDRRRTDRAFRRHAGGHGDGSATENHAVAVERPSGRNGGGRDSGGIGHSGVHPFPSFG